MSGIRYWSRLGDPGEALDRRAVEPGPVLDRALELVDRDRDGLDVADDVGELELDEADPARLGGFDLRGGLGAAGPRLGGASRSAGMGSGVAAQGYARPREASAGRGSRGSGPKRPQYWKSSSRYFGSGQRSSATTRLELVDDLAQRCLGRDDLGREGPSPRPARSRPRGPRAGRARAPRWRRRASRRGRETVRQIVLIPCDDGAPAELAEVPRGGRQDHRRGDVERRSSPRCR